MRLLSEWKVLPIIFFLHNIVRFMPAMTIVFTWLKKKNRLQSGAPAASAPFPIHLTFRIETNSCLRRGIKEHFCLTRDNHTFVSQHIGDMENEETLEHFEPYDWALQTTFPHWAGNQLPVIYIRSTCRVNMLFVLRAGRVLNLSRCNITMPILSVAWQRTEQIHPLSGSIRWCWLRQPTELSGAENFLVADWEKFQRFGHFEYVPMPGGAAAIKKALPYGAGVYLFITRRWLFARWIALCWT